MGPLGREISFLLISTFKDSKSVEFLVTKSEKSGEYQMLIYNQHPPDEPIVENINLEIEGLPTISDVTIQRIDEDHGNPLRIWKEMGEPRYFKAEYIEKELAI